MFFHFKLVIAITTSAKDISLELMAGWEAEPRATGSSQLVINPQEMPVLPSLLLKHHYRKFSQFQYMEIWGYYAKPMVFMLVNRPPLSTEDVIITTTEGKILFS